MTQHTARQSCGRPGRVAGILVLIALAGATTPAGAGHDGFHRYSVAREFSTSYGVGVTRWDNTMTNIPNDGCSQPISGHPMYQTQWVIISTGNWVEFGGSTR